MYQLFIKQKVFKLTDHYPVLDVDGNAVYYVDQSFQLLGDHFRLRRLDGKRALSINREVFTILPRFLVENDDGTSFRVSQRFSLFGKKIDLESDDYNLYLRGSFWDYNFDVYEGKSLVGRIQKKFLTWGDSFVIDVYDPDFEEELLALLICVDLIQDRNNS